ncbi:MAG: hypothetical protein KatS3mg009_2084 [Acidimicrobiia bacterium]|nr:MAG: hypothetical protein KatS3mg009_2084 [Acidimicrobiia bacterium]
MLARRTGVAAATARLELASQALASGAPGADDDYDAALARFLACGGADLDRRLGAVSSGVGLPDELLDRPTTALSGGEAARASLAAILLARHDVFLLDEPTNDLDFDGLALLEGYLRDLEGGAVIVSHDRAFLDRTIDSVLEIDEHTPPRHALRGWLAGVPRRTRGRAAPRARALRRVRAAARRAARPGPSAIASGRPAGSPAPPASGETRQVHPPLPDADQRAARGEGALPTRRAQQRLEAEAVPKPWEGWELRMEVADGARAGGDLVAALRDAVVHRGPFTLGPCSLEVRAGERVAILGRNGAGKSTLLGALLGRVALDGGEHRLGPSVVAGELDQARARYAGTEPLLDVFVAATGSDLRPRARRSRSSGSAPGTSAAPAHAVARRTDARGPRPVHRRRRELPGARRTDQPPRPARRSSSSSPRSARSPAPSSSSPTTGRSSTRSASTGGCSWSRGGSSRTTRRGTALSAPQATTSITPSIPYATCPGRWQA